ncbi:hypothetical protein BsWGS_00189 [Bradybaena similaris]
MANYCDLYVIGEESENDAEDDIVQNEPFNSADVNVSAMFNELSSGNKEKDNTSVKSVSRLGLGRDRNFQNDADRRPSSVRKSTSRVKNMIFEPTYRMEPMPDQYFVWYKVRNLLNKTIAPLFESFSYSSKAAGNFIKMICNKSITVVKKKFEWPRYRYVCHVTLMELNHQAAIVAERSIKFAETDNNAVCLFTKKEYIMVVTFYGIFQE